MTVKQVKLLWGTADACSGNSIRIFAEVIHRSASVDPAVALIAITGTNHVRAGPTKKKEGWAQGQACSLRSGAVRNTPGADSKRAVGSPTCIGRDNRSVWAQWGPTRGKGAALLHCSSNFQRANMLPKYVILCLLVATVRPAFGASGDISLLTFNAGFATPSTPNTQTHDARRAALVNSIATDQVWRGTDVACVQEIRLYDDFTTISEALRKAGFIHQHNLLDRFPPPVAGQAACKERDRAPLQAFVDCVEGLRTAVCRTPAVQTSRGLMGTCTTLYCIREVEVLTQACVECLFDMQYRFAVNTSVTASRCLQAPDTLYRPSLGLLLASRRPMTQLESVLFKGIFIQARTSRGLQVARKPPFRQKKKKKKKVAAFRPRPA